MPFYLFEWSMNWKIKTLSDPFKIPTRNICMCTGVLLFYFLTLRSIFWVFVLASFSSSCFIFSSFVLSYFIFRENKVFNVLFWLMFNTIACVYKFCLFAICFLWEYFSFSNCIRKLWNIYKGHNRRFNTNCRYYSLRSFRQIFGRQTKLSISY